MILIEVGEDTLALEISPSGALCLDGEALAGRAGTVERAVVLAVRHYLGGCPCCCLPGDNSVGAHGAPVCWESDVAYGPVEEEES